MITDSQFNFIPPGQPLSLVGAAGVSFRSAIVDLLGAGVGQAPPGIIGLAIPFGVPDPGIGGIRPEIDMPISTTFTTANSATVNAQLQYAPDLGAGGGYQPGTWVTAAETGTIAAANLLAGNLLARFPFLPNPPGTTRVRFVSINFVIPSATNFTAGAIGFSTITLVRDDQANKFAGKNFSV
jgi:hypothetical protein